MKALFRLYYSATHRALRKSGTWLAYALHYCVLCPIAISFGLGLFFLFYAFCSFTVGLLFALLLAPVIPDAFMPYPHFIITAILFFITFLLRRDEFYKDFREAIQLLNLKNKLS